MSLLRGSVVVLALLSATGCATTGATYGSGVGDTYLEHPPFYAGRSLESLDPVAQVGYLPVAYQPGASQPALFDPELSEDLRALLADMTAYLGERGIGVALTGGSDGADGDGGGGRLTPPDVHLACVTESGTPDDDCAEREDEALGRGSQPMRLAVGRPSPEWIAWADGAMRGAGVDQALVVTLEIGQHWIRQRGWRGIKEVELGTGHVVRFPWLTSLEGPVAVVQLTGVLVGRDGKAIRIGGEGLLAKRTSMIVSVLGGQSLVTDEEIAQLRTARRGDLPDRPLVWQEGLRSLVEQLTGR